MLQENTSLQSLNIESNFITADGMKAIIKAMASNATLVELKIDNQVSPPLPPPTGSVLTGVCVCVCVCSSEAEAGGLGGDGDRLHAGEQLQHPEVRLPL